MCKANEPWFSCKFAIADTTLYLINLHEKESCDTDKSNWKLGLIRDEVRGFMFLIALKAKKTYYTQKIWEYTNMFCWLVTRGTTAEPKQLLPLNFGAFLFQKQ